ncbi:MAG: ABC transporter ATP-binding protein [Bacillota bacterium]
MNNVLVTEQVTKSFDGLVAVNKANIVVKENTFTMLIGPNGSGKTTLINCCTGILKPTSGRIMLGDIDITGWKPHQIYDVGFVRSFQIPLPFVGLTVLDNVLAAMRNVGEGSFNAIRTGTWIEQEEENLDRAMDILEKVGLEKQWDLPSASLGASQLKMLEVAKGLSSGAKIIALDEPIGGVDTASAHEILGHVAELKEKEGLTFFVVEHRIDIAAPFADYVYAMDLGTIISEGSPNQVLTDPKVIEVYLGKGVQKC